MEKRRLTFAGMMVGELVHTRFKLRPVQSTVRLARLYFPWDTSTYAHGCVIATICIGSQEQYSLFKTAPGNFYTQGYEIIASKLSFT